MTRYCKLNHAITGDNREPEAWQAGEYKCRACSSARKALWNGGVEHPSPALFESTANRYFVRFLGWHPPTPQFCFNNETKWSRYLTEHAA